MKKIQFTTIITDNLNGKRLDAALSQAFTDYSRNQIQQWIEAGWVTVDQKVIQKTRHTVKTGQVIELRATLEEKIEAAAENIALNIVYEDSEIIVINKPAGLVVHPGAGNTHGTLMNALLHHDATLHYLPRAGIIHRLDKDTSGLLVIARTLPAYQALLKQMRRREIQREYRAIVEGIVISGGTIDAPIGRHPTARTKMAVVEDAKEAITHYRVLERFAAHTLLSVQLETGRTHQIRVHLAHKHYPIVGDRIYTKKQKSMRISMELQKELQAFSRQALHAYRLSLIHPITQQRLEWTAPMPEDMQRLNKLLSRTR
ncbi:MAG: hypothetical protein ACD_70C00132G0003 [uncultured bacterium]|nr:MAG: hypothetical protein ACD_70C00132G0003 [uncultured bacterium]OGT27165.1 MAG: RNA pseudouridine synthase [Gammaproteobacteria bacterium RIFCSPHIGHO2_02_FULL_42_43]OGT29560.1 MAG: RNA pseudouridine synthase [Gammaproteobacteria bacterium RIFCSPHIGHO2_01_FULL_42_8]OGT50781.1 MAG: RNA pseudouridine synthase [Gammaproteobacteria bacterium RIFCSPHIGHO2_12_FULL_41_25]OGT61765.1 MAG: RNA pseudouridine synthase [Gammaproteobacteria bacterium RIFCSPLOWO2_02_FULL_42_14]OGT85510.1 MAG: RNA pseudou